MIWAMQGYSTADKRPTGTHVQILDAGTAGWEVLITFHDPPLEAKRIYFPTYTAAKHAAQSLATGV